MTETISNMAQRAMYAVEGVTHAILGQRSMEDQNVDRIIFGLKNSEDLFFNKMDIPVDNPEANTTAAPIEKDGQPDPYPSQNGQQEQGKGEGKEGENPEGKQTEMGTADQPIDNRTVGSDQIQQSGHSVQETEKREQLSCCPYENDFYTNGVISSPFYPNNYPNFIKCYYYISAELGSVVKFNFTYFDLESCCDFVTIHDSDYEDAPILVQFGGPNATATKPSGVFYSSSRYALMTFTTDRIVSKTGFQMTYESANTATPCNRDILLVINGLSSVGTQANFVKQLDFIANYLISSWSVGPTQTQVFLSMQTDKDYAVICDFESLFRYGAGDEDDQGQLFNHRRGIQQIQIIFVAQNPNNDQDFYEAEDFSHDMRDRLDTKVITVAMGDNIDAKKVGSLSYGDGFWFGASYDKLPTLASAINKAICQNLASGCGV
uniref:CUB domain-containing protein n=1 Tax=Panagrolaimus sp. JU765 TaxID=591449 RepID=A0AC34QUA4_9BILA